MNLHTDDVVDILRQAQQLGPASRLRVAAALIDRGEAAAAAALAEGVCVELNAILAHAANAPRKAQ